MVYAYVKTTPYDSVKYEVDKKTGYLLVDRPQRTSSQPPNLYGFIPLAYCGQRVTALCPRADEGGGDPLDICVVSERLIERPVWPFSGRAHGELRPYGSTVIDSDSTLSPAGSPATS